MARGLSKPGTVQVPGEVKKERGINYMTTSYEEKKARRIERYRELAVKAKGESDRRYKTVRQILDHIPMGQPILVGHHSEGRHRRDLKRVDINMRKSIEADEKAAYYERRANYAESNRAISSDDPKAAGRLREKIAELEENQRYMKEVNRRFKKEGPGMIETLPLEVQTAILNNLKYSFYNVPFPPYSLSNNNTNIRRLKKRLEDIERKAQDTTEETTINGVRIVENVEENRVQLFFPGIPSEEIRSFLKSHGFRWSRTFKCWQRHRSYSASYYAQKAVEMLN
jgi:hypothetical protein